ncbi:MAG: hypothetical protein DUD39_02670 [Coriobacteriaceae bacterium]|nr:MAG: hypothetical protein DUD39_02670 [Coriobacteriaceae bacterium]
MLDAMGRSGLQRGVSGRQGLIRIARRGDAESHGVAVMEVLRPKRDKRRRSRQRHTGAKVEGWPGRGGKGPRACKRDMRADVDGCIQRRQVPARSGSGGDPLEVCQGGGTFEMMRSLARKRPKGAELVADSLLVLQALAKNRVAELEELVQDNAPSLLKI